MDYQQLIADVFEQAQDHFGKGAVADYIPALARVDPHKFGIALETVDGECFEVGDAGEKFSIQSIAKVFNLALDIKLCGDEIWNRVGVEPSGNPFNSLVQLEYEQGIPRNPFINAGALVVIDMLLDHLDDPNDEMLTFARQLRCEEILYDPEVVASERDTGFINVALANFMKAHNNVRYPVDDVLDVYFHQCAITMSCRGLARAFLFLANRGVVPSSGQRILSQQQTRRLNAIMLTCGFYDEAGEFAFCVGLPGKSGVGGGIVAVLPGEFAIAVWSPELNEHGNSVVGIRALELFARHTGSSIF